MSNVSAYFFGEPGGAHDKAATHIFETHGGHHIGSGTLLVGPSAGERDVQYDVPDDRLDDCKATLKKAGFQLGPTPIDLSTLEGIPDAS